MLHLNEQGDQLRRAISDKDMLMLRTAVGCDRFAQRGVLSVRITRNYIQMLGKGSPELSGETKRVDVCRKARDIFFFDAVDLFYFF